MTIPTGFDEVNAQLFKVANVCDENYVVLLWDEMKNKEDLVFDRNTSVITDINNHLNDGDLLMTITQIIVLLLICSCSWCRVCLLVWNFPTFNFQLKVLLLTFFSPIVWEAAQ